MVLFCFFDSPFTMNSHPNLPRFLRKTAQICLCIDMCGAKKTVETFSEWPHRAHRRMAKPPRVPMGSVVNGHAPAYGVWWLYTHLEWGTWGTAAFFSSFFSRGSTREHDNKTPGSPPARSSGATYIPLEIPNETGPLWTEHHRHQHAKVGDKRVQIVERH
jgi:hypothetical protein